MADRECDTCPEYKDYHCEKWCTVIRQTIADLKEDWIPIEVIERYREKLIQHRDTLPQHTMRWMMVDEDICVVDEILKYSKKGEQK